MRRSAAVLSIIPYSAYLPNTIKTSLFEMLPCVNNNKQFETNKRHTCNK